MTTRNQFCSSSSLIRLSGNPYCHSFWCLHLLWVASGHFPGPDMLWHIPSATVFSNLTGEPNYWTATILVYPLQIDFNMQWGSSRINGSGVESPNLIPLIETLGLFIPLHLNWISYPSRLSQGINLWDRLSDFQILTARIRLGVVVAI